jgi:hypothetical protein
MANHLLFMGARLPVDYKSRHFHQHRQVHFGTSLAYNWTIAENKQTKITNVKWFSLLKITDQV